MNLVKVTAMARTPKLLNSAITYNYSMARNLTSAVGNTSAAQDVTLINDVQDTDASSNKSSLSGEIPDSKEKGVFGSIKWNSIPGSPSQVAERHNDLSRRNKRNLIVKRTEKTLMSSLISEWDRSFCKSKIENYIKKARNTRDKDIALEELRSAYEVFVTMRKKGIEIREETYRIYLVYTIDMGLVKEFCVLCEEIEKEDPNSLIRLAYHKMLLWIKLEDKDKILMLIANAQISEDSNCVGGYMLALSESERHEEVSMLIKTIDITKISSEENMEMIFKSLGRLCLESHAKKFIWELKVDGQGGHDNLSNLVYSYAMSIPNISIEDIVIKFKNLQADLSVASSIAPYKKLIKTSCDSLKVYLAVDLVEFVFNEGLTVQIDTFNFIFKACDMSYDYHLVYGIAEMMKAHNIHPNAETFRRMIVLYAKLKDYDGAYSVIENLKRLKFAPTAHMYNAIMAGYFRQKNFDKGLMVLKQMSDSNVEPNSFTFSYIIGNCNSEDDIIKYHREMQQSGIQPTKHIFVALIYAYARCGLFNKAKQVLSGDRIAVNDLNEIKSELVSALASNGQLTDALEIYDDLKQLGEKPKPKSTICLIEHLKSEGELSRLLHMLEQLQDTIFWHHGCAKIILYTARYKLLGPAVDLLKQRMEKLSTNGMAKDVMFDEVFCQIADTEPVDVQFGLDLLKEIKDNIGIRPSRRCLDFLLTACMNANDLEHSFSVWKEYEMAGLPYNVISYLWMYEALLASEGYKAAEILLEDIPCDDLDVYDALKECEATFGTSSTPV